MYTGEVRVFPGQLTALMQAAHVLCVRGLVEGSITAEVRNKKRKLELRNYIFLMNVFLSSFMKISKVLLGN